jgi:hypothetical protein
METEIKVDRTIFKKFKIEEAENDFIYWQSQPYTKRLETLESIRQEYNLWKYDNQQGFQRVYRIIKQA